MKVLIDNYDSNQLNSIQLKEQIDGLERKIQDQVKIGLLSRIFKSKEAKEKIILDKVNEAKMNLIASYSEGLWRDFPLSNGKGKEREEHYHRFLMVADGLYPKARICSYFYDCYPRNIVGLNGLKLLINHFNQKEDYLGALKNADAVTLEEFEREIQQWNAPIASEEREFLVQISGKHITPVFVKRFEGKSQVVTLDSLGESDGHSYGTDIENILRARMEGPIEVYKFIDQRQRDGTSCPIFSLRDLLEHKKKSLFDYIDQKKKSEERTNYIKNHFKCNSDSYLLLNLPASFLKVAQDISTLYKYQDSPELVSASPKASPRDRLHVSEVKMGRTLKDLKDDYGQTNYTRQRAYKYYSIIINNALKSSH
ncbi:MAG: hypothetical protein ACO3A2_04710 [Bdellovibrionia bacterium]